MKTKACRSGQRDADNNQKLADKHGPASRNGLKERGRIRCMNGVRSTENTRSHNENIE